ncbi:MAG: hypothetical protein ACYTAN_09840 [Planctomycetota bacterium]
MKQCQMCGSPMRVDAELVEGQRRYHWYKCTNMKCGAIFLVQERIARRSAARRSAAKSAMA